MYKVISLCGAKLNTQYTQGYKDLPLSMTSVITGMRTPCLRAMSPSYSLDTEEGASQRVGCVKMLPREVPSLYGSFPAELHQALEGFVPAPDLDKARNRAAQQQAAAAPRSTAFSLEQWRWALSVRMPLVPQHSSL